VEGQSETP
jgi:hypothetical protein